MLNHILYFFRDKYKKPYFQILKEVIELTLKNKVFPKHYFSRAFYHKNIIYDYKDFMDMNTYFKILDSKKFKNPSLETLLYNKLSFDVFCNQNNIPVPKVLSYNFNQNFYYNKKLAPVNSSEMLKEYFLSILKNEKNEKIFLKKIHGHQGIGTILLTDKTTDLEFKTIFNSLKTSSYLHQDFIEQHKDINEIFHKTINSLRLETYIDNNNEIQFLGAFMRIGQGNSIADNLGVGGLFVPVNIQNGTLFEFGYFGKYNFKSKCYKHPDTHFIFNNFKIPFFEESKNEVLRATELLPKRIIGWDVAITPNGPIILEGNYKPALFFGEFTYGGYTNNPIFKEIIKEAAK